MSDVSAILGLPYIQPSQSQKHVTHNEALASLDALVQAAVKGRTLVTPPAAPQTGDAWLVAPSGAVNAWAGQENALTWWDGAGWRFAAPRPGWTVYDLAEGGPLVFDAAQGWIRLPVSLDGLDMLGVNGAADTTNRLAVSSSAVLLNHQGAGHQLKINKAGATDTASLMFQTGFSGRAEMGTAGNNDFSIKVSPDGAAWTEALRVDRTSGQVTGAAVQSGPSDATPGRLMKTGAFGIGGLSPFLSDISVTDNSLPAGGVFGFSTAGGRYRRAGGGHTRPDDPVAACHGRRRGAGDGRRRGIGDPPGHHAVTGAHLGRLVALAADILGTVSQTGGVATGAIIETGTNANGTYTRWADGTQICRGVITVASVSCSIGFAGGFRSGTGPSITYAATFASSPAIAPCQMTSRERTCWCAVSLQVPRSLLSASCVSRAALRITSERIRPLVAGRPKEHPMHTHAP